MPTRPHDDPDRPKDGTRVPPHDLPAERALLGAWLLSRDALDQALPLTAPADFYRPAHATVADAIAHLHARSEPVDPITVAAHLGDTLTDLGGTAWLVDLQAEAPGVANAAHYARIVADHARHRRLIEAAQQLAAEAWDADDPAQVLVDHRARLDQLGASIATGSHLRVADVGEVIDGGAKVIDADLLARTDGRCLFYAGHMHTLQAAPSTGKSWVACTAIADVIALDGSAVYLDWEDSPAGIIGRLLALGVDPDSLRTRFAYARVDGSWGAAETAGAHQLLDRLNPDLVVLDGVAEAMAHDGLDENAAPDFMAWAVRVPRPIAATGAAVVMLDHTKKDTDKTDRYARGSGAKLAAIDGAAYVVTVAEPYSRTRSGRMALTVAKDRHGGVGAIGETVAHIVVEPHAAGEHVTMTVEPPPEPAGPDGQWAPTRIMVRVSALLERGPLEVSAIHAQLQRSKRGHVELAIRELIRLGHVENTRGLTGSHALRLVRPYHDPSAGPAPTDEEAQQALSLDNDGPAFDPDPGF